MSDGLGRPVKSFESPYALRPGEDLWDAYRMLREAGMSDAFEIENTIGMKVTLGELAEMGPPS
jgi:hypothetical protein